MPRSVRTVMMAHPWAQGFARFRDDQSRYRWYALAVTTFTQDTSVTVTSAIGPLAPLLMAQIAISRGEVGLIQTSLYLSATWSALVGGRLADRMGERSALLLSGVLTGVRREPIQARVSLKALVVLTLSLVSFGVLMRHAGFIPALVVLAFGSAAAGKEFELVEVLLLTLALTGLAVGIFIWGLGLPYPRVKGF